MVHRIGHSTKPERKRSKRINTKTRKVDKSSAKAIAKAVRKYRKTFFK